MVGTHDTPTFAGWLDGGDIPERVHLGLLAPDAEAGERAGREAATLALASAVHGDLDAPDELVALVLEWLGASDSPLVITWLEDLWLEVLPVNIPGSGSDEWPNWQRPMSLLLDRVVQDPGVNRILERLDAARRAASAG
jgi:4-alpha-glucanotransferase